MPSNERGRLTLFGQLETVLGVESAEHLMELLPPVGWADVATRVDVEQCRDTVRLEIRAVEARLEGKVDRLSGEVAALRIELSAKIELTETELHTRIDLTAAELRAEMRQLATDLRAEMQQLATDLRAEMAELRAGQAALGTRLDEMEQRFRADTRSMVSELETRMQGGHRTILLTTVGLFATTWGTVGAALALG